MTPQLSADDNISKNTRNIDVQTLTQANFDGMSLAQQQFMRDRIAAGLVKIVSSEDITPPQPPQQPNSSGNSKKLQKSNKTPNKPDNSKDSKATTVPTRKPYTNPVQRLLNKPVKVILNNGHVRTGILTELWQFEIILKGATTDTELIVMKHTIASIEEDKTTYQTKIIGEISS